MTRTEKLAIKAHRYFESALREVSEIPQPKLKRGECNSKQLALNILENGLSFTSRIVELEMELRRIVDD